MSEENIESQEIVETPGYMVGGKLFATKHEAVAYKNASVYSERVDKFIASKTWSRGQDTSARKRVIEFLAFEDAA